MIATVYVMVLLTMKWISSLLPVISILSTTLLVTGAITSEQWWVTLSLNEYAKERAFPHSQSAVRVEEQLVILQLKSSSNSFSLVPYSKTTGLNFLGHHQQSTNNSQFYCVILYT